MRLVAQRPPVRTDYRDGDVLERLGAATMAIVAGTQRLGFFGEPVRLDVNAQFDSAAQCLRPGDVSVVYLTHQVPQLARIESAVVGVHGFRQLLEPRVAFGLDDPAGRQLILDDLTARDDPRLIWSVASRVAIYNRSLPGAERIARLLIDPSQRDSIRVLGHVTLAHLLLAQGRWREARAQIGQVREIDPLTALIYTVALSTTGIVPELTNSEKIRIRDELLAIEVPAPTGQPATELTVHDSIHDRLRLYALGNIADGQFSAHARTPSPVGRILHRVCASVREICPAWFPGFLRWRAATAATP